MGYRIGSFNLRNLGLAAMGNGNSRNLRTIANIIRDEGFDVVALQEVLSQGKAFMSEDYAKKSILMELGPDWDFSWADAGSESDPRHEGFAFVWRKSKLRLSSTMVNTRYGTVERVFYPRMCKTSQADLFRRPYYGRFTTQGVLGGPNVEFRLVCVHTYYGKTDSIADREIRQKELDVLMKEVYPQLSDRRYGDPLDSYTIDAEWSRLSEKIERCIKIVETFSQKRNILKLDEKKGNVSFYRRNEYSFEEYLAKNTNIIQKYYRTQKTILAIIHEHSWLGQDLILSTGTITLFEGKKRKGTILYTEIEKCYDQGGIKFDKALFKNDSIDMKALKALIKELAAIQEEYSQKQKDDKLKDIVQKIEVTMSTESKPAPIKAYTDTPEPAPVNPNQVGKIETGRTSSPPERIDMQKALIKNISAVREQMVKNVTPEKPHIIHDGPVTDTTKKPPVAVNQDFKQPGILQVDKMSEVPGNVVSVLARGEYGPICVGAKYRIHLLHTTRDFEPYFVNGFSKNEYVVTGISCNTDVKYVECGKTVMVDLVKGSS